MEKANLGEAFASDGPRYKCPHCDYLNPKPEKRYLEGVSAVLCRRCQRGIPLENFDKAPDSF